jgi:smad nuclear-interacting protein 1
MYIESTFSHVKPWSEPALNIMYPCIRPNSQVNGVVLKFSEPPEARLPRTRWLLYTFKNGALEGDPLKVSKATCYLFGRERRVADVPTDHPSCSGQHAVLQYRLTEKEAADGMMRAEVRPYLMDLGSTNGTFLNGERIEPQRYYELLEKDVVKFGNSTREYVLLHEQSA